MKIEHGRQHLPYTLIAVNGYCTMIRIWHCAMNKIPGYLSGIIVLPAHKFDFFEWLCIVLAHLTQMDWSGYLKKLLVSHLILVNNGVLFIGLILYGELMVAH